MPSVAVIGVGAVGGFLAGELLDAGRADVTLCARGPFEALVIDSRPRATVTTHDLAAATDPAAITGTVDVVVLATKAHQSPAAQGWLERLCRPTTVVVVAQNGVEHEERLAQLVDATVLPAVVYCGTEALAPGHVVHHNTGFLIVPEGEPARTVADLFPAGVIRTSGDWVTRAWQKLTLNVVANGITALTGRRMDVLRDPAVEPLILALAEECAAAGGREGAHLDRHWPRQVLEMVRAAPDGQGTSMLYDRMAGRPLEWDAMHGAVVRAARRHGLEVPVVAGMAALLSVTA